MAKSAQTDQNKKLLMAAATRFGAGVILLGAYLFLCSGNLGYWNAWLYLIALFGAILCFGVYLYNSDKELLKKRLNTKEKESEQKAYVISASISFLAAFGLCGLDDRYNWSQVPLAAVIIALIVMLAGFGLFVLTLMQNRFASRVVEIQNEQKVIDTGVYSLVRHPMYTATLLMFFASPFVLGSYYALIPMLVYLAGIILRIKNEEKVLIRGLEGYLDYTKRVRYRLIPYIW